ncbi:MAG: HD domain-containing protein [Lachnospiraceae bacterium]|nr:HD domain-containing protein [Lachnospiraceae bacterium]
MIKKICKIDELTGKERLANNIMTSDYNVLLSEGIVLRQDYIDKLRELNIKEVYIWDEKEIEESVAILKNDLEESFKSKVRDILEKHTYCHNEELVELCQTADHIIINILEEEEVLQQIYDIRERSSDIYEHSVSICSLATVVALRMNLSHELVHDIGVGCLLHDLGLRYLTADYINHDLKEMTEFEYSEYKKHPVYAYSALQGENWISNVSKNMILYHHERIDGSGYPLKATDIPLECRIIQVCDVFDEMICGIGCKRVKVYEAVEYLKNFKDIKYDGRIVDIFLEFTAVYPAGTYVRTNEDEIGIVMRQNKQFPGRPVLRIVEDRNGDAVNIIKDLLEVNNIYIKEVIG